jgi:hypothetical protein
MAHPTFPVRLVAGAAAGLAGTFVLQGLLAGSGRWAPATLPPIRRDPAEFMVEQAESALPAARRPALPPAGRAAAEKGLQLGYGMTFGVLYGLVAGAGSPVLAGVALGLATWAVGYLGWLPAAGLMPPVTRQEPARVAGPIATHVGYGIATGAAYQWLSGRLGR